MTIVFALLLVALGVVSLVAYGGTPHIATSTCGPITAFNQTVVIPVDCRVASFVELAVALFAFMMAVILALVARPRRRVE